MGPAKTQFLAKFDRVFNVLDLRFDGRNGDLTVLVLSCLQNSGQVSVNRRKQFALTVPDAVFAAIKEAWSEL